MTRLSAEISYFPDEGRSHLADCLALSIDRAKKYGIEKLVIFTARGDGIDLALDMCERDSDCSAIRIVGVTFPQGKVFNDPDHPGQSLRVEISPERLSRFKQAGVPIIRARLPFDPIAASFKDHGVLGQDFSLIGNALSIFCGSMSLCVQAALIACDAAEVIEGEHIIAVTSDTAILVQAAPTNRFLHDLVVREILCKPLFLTIGKKEDVPPSLAEYSDDESNESPPAEPKMLPPNSE
jgi:hypothetical protein